MPNESENVVGRLEVENRTRRLKASLLLEQAVMVVDGGNVRDVVLMKSALSPSDKTNVIMAWANLNAVEFRKIFEEMIEADPAIVNNVFNEYVNHGEDLSKLDERPYTQQLAKQIRDRLDVFRKAELKKKDEQK